MFYILSILFNDCFLHELSFLVKSCTTFIYFMGQLSPFWRVKCKKKIFEQSFNVQKLKRVKAAFSFFSPSFLEGLDFLFSFSFFNPHLRTCLLIFTERERNIHVIRDKSIGCFCNVPQPELIPQPRQVPWGRIQAGDPSVYRTALHPTSNTS